MSKHQNGDGTGRPLQNGNPVAKHARKFNKAVVFRDRRRYSRKSKHRGSELFPMHLTVSSGAWGKAAAVSAPARAAIAWR